MELGCSTILYGGYSLDEALDGIAKAGYKAIELCARPGMAPHLEIGRPVDYYKEIKDKIESRGLAIESIGGTGGVGLGGDDLPKLLEAANIIGATFIAEGAGGRFGMVKDETFSAEYKASLKGVTDILNNAAEKASKYGVKLSIKPHVGTAIYSAETVLLAMRDLNQEWVGINYDPSHIWRSGDRAEDPVESLKKVKQYVFTLRIRDNRELRERPIGPVEYQIPGKGAMPLPVIADVMKSIKGVPYATLEIVGTHSGTGYPLGDVQDVVEQSFAYLKPLFE